MLVGTWITPQGASTSDSSYATLTLDAPSAGGEVYQFAGGASMTTPISQWRIEADCSELHWDYGSGWLADYSVIHQLSSTVLELEATDGSYYGQISAYSREGSAGDGGAACVECEECWDQGLSCVSNGTCNVCGDADPNVGSDSCQRGCGADIDCGAGESCLNSAGGYVCLPPDCQGCWDAGSECSYVAATCVFDSCS